MPIYYVIVEPLRGSQISMQFNIGQILHVFECDIKDIDKYWREYGLPLVNEGRNIYTYYFVREPANPLKEFNKSGNV